MADAVIDTTWRTSDPERIETDLAELWRDLARETPLTRAVLSNLVVFCHRPGQAPVDLVQLPGVPLEDVVQKHPSRVIVLHHDLGPKEICGPLAASIGVLTFGPPHARFGVEQIAIRSACAAASLPSIVRRLTLGDIPTSVWWTEDLSEVPPLDALATAGRQFLYDSRRWRDVRRAILALGPLLGMDLSDVNWRRLTPLRQALLHAWQSPDLLDWNDPITLEIRHAAGEAALAWLLVGWLDAALSTHTELRARVEEVATADEILTASFGTAPPDLIATLTSEIVVVKARGGVPFAVGIPVETEADAVASELRALARDVCLQDTLAALIKRFSAVR